MKIASIDIGTNTVLMLVAKLDMNLNSFKTIKNFYEMPRIGRGLVKDSPIGKNEVKKLFDVLSNYKMEIDKYGCDLTLVTATNALRIASNSEDIKNNIQKILGCEVNIISGEEEALYSFLGATSSTTRDGDYLVIDIGGGSTEIILGNKESVDFRKSYSIGAVSLTEKFVTGYPVNKDEIDKMNIHISDNFQELVDKFNGKFNMIAVAGTPTTLSCIHQGLKTYIEEKVEDSILKEIDLQKIIFMLSQRTPQEIQEDFGEVVKGREDVLLTGSLILYNFLRLLQINEFLISGNGIRYGTVVKFMNDLISKRQ